VISAMIAAVLMLPTRTRIGLHGYFGALCDELVDAEQLLHGGLGFGDRGHEELGGVHGW
jgi:hypothetical protein